MSPWICCSCLQLAAPIGRSPFAALPFPFLDKGGGITAVPHCSTECPGGLLQCVLVAVTSGAQTSENPEQIQWIGKLDKLRFDRLCWSH